MFNTFQHLFNGRLEEYLKTTALKKPQSLYEAESYMLKLGGKRIRPYLVYLGACAANGNQAYAMDAALSVEVFHNFSLIHDDWLDQSQLRRGQATVHNKWNAQQSILTGDVMLANSFALLQSYPDSVCGTLSKILSKTAFEVCEGQQLDLDFEHTAQITEAEYLHMIRLKTAVLLGCSLQLGVITAGGNIELQHELYQFGVDTGIAFQILDDYLDAFAETTGSFGKTIGGDILGGKKTLLWIYSNSKKELPKLKIESHASNFNSEKIKLHRTWYNETGATKHCLDTVSKYHKQAHQRLQHLDINSAVKNALNTLLLELEQRLV
jgi:geranylgeranyl diphosphate synthase type II